MRKVEQDYYKQLEEGRARVVPVRSVMHLHKRATADSPTVLGIKPGEVGLVSRAELLHNKGKLVEVSVDGWSADGFKDGDPIKKAKANVETKGSTKEES
jgi:hypothetical protein